MILLSCIQEVGSCCTRPPIFRHAFFLGGDRGCLIFSRLLLFRILQQTSGMQNCNCICLGKIILVTFFVTASPQFIGGRLLASNSNVVEVTVPSH